MTSPKSLEQIAEEARRAWAFTSSPKPEEPTREAPERREHGCPEVFRGASPDVAEWRARVNVAFGIKDALKLIREEKENVFLYGHPGAGKSTLAAMAFQEKERDMGHRAKWTSQYDIEAAARWGNLKDGFPSELSIFFRCPLLVIDGLLSNPYGNTVAHILNKRYDNGRLATWVTSEFAIEELAPKYDGGVLRRMYRDATVIRLGEVTE